MSVYRNQALERGQCFDGRDGNCGNLDLNGEISGAKM